MIFLRRQGNKIFSSFPYIFWNTTFLCVMCDHLFFVQMDTKHSARLVIVLIQYLFSKQKSSSVSHSQVQGGILAGNLGTRIPGNHLNSQVNFSVISGEISSTSIGSHKAKISSNPVQVLAVPGPAREAMELPRIYIDTRFLVAIYVDCRTENSAQLG